VFVCLYAVHNLQQHANVTVAGGYRGCRAQGAQELCGHGPDVLGGIYIGGPLACEADKSSEVLLMLFNLTDLTSASTYSSCVNGWCVLWPEHPWTFAGPSGRRATK